MECQLSTPSISLSGVPLLPPLITNDITTEIQYYKQLAIAVEERLKALEILKATNLENYKDKPNKEHIEVPKGDNVNLVYQSQSDNVAQNITLIDSALLDYPTKDKIENLIDISIPTSDTVTTEILIEKYENISEPKERQVEQINKTIPDENKSCLSENLLDDSGGSDTITASTDLHQYLNTSNSARTDTTDTTPENWKPQVPRTLDIVPITVDQCKPPDKSSSSDNETPKLVRQGSYVLDTPSPMLLAHMQNESSNIDYTPTSDQSAKRKECSISQTKTNWVTQNNTKGSITSRSTVLNKNKKNNVSNIPSQRNCKSVSNSKAGSPLDVHQSARSVDCIQTMFSKDCYSPKTLKSRVSSQNFKYSSPVNGTNGIRNNSSKKTNKNTSILNSVNKLTASLSSLNNVIPKPVKKVERKNDNGTIVNKSFDQDFSKSNNSSSDSKKQKPVITSEKIITVFREIQDTHKKQMIELISRQQKEQTLMQENFKKQQIILLAQIRKAFPEISVSSLSEAICSKNVDHTTPLSSKTVNERSDSIYENAIDKPQVNGIDNFENNRQTIVKSSVNYTYPSRESSSTSCYGTIQSATSSVTSYYQSNSQNNQDKCPSMLMSCTQLSNIRVIDDIPVGNHVRRHSNVSRQLFPLENRKKIFSVINDSMYTAKHIKAATIINAYAKGFLVRRLMKTEKIIELKNTYKEALHCMLRLHVDAPLNLPELNFHQRLQLQCDAASMNIVDLFSQSPIKRMEIIAHDRELKKARSDRPSSTRSYSFATQRTLARKKMKEMGIYSSLYGSMMSKSCPPRTRCQTWTSSLKERKATTSFINQGIKRSTSAGAVRKPWR